MSLGRKEPEWRKVLAFLGFKVVIVSASVMLSGLVFLKSRYVIEPAGEIFNFAILSTPWLIRLTGKNPIRDQFLGWLAFPGRFS